jgi:isopropylmalate/homocitrate/citramalate synthase
MCNKIEIGTHFPIYNYIHKIPLISSITNPDDIERITMNHIQNVTCISSVSSKYLEKTHNISLDENKENISNIVKMLETIHYKKLYIYCVNKCPFLGTIDNKFILHEIFDYNMKYNFDELCISDNTGTLSFDDYKYIVDSVVFFGVPKTNLSLDLYVNTRNIHEIEKIIRYSLRNNISKFNVSIANDGSLLQPLSYSIFYEIVKKEIEYCVNISL